MKNFDDTDLIALAIIGLGAWLFWLGKDSTALALVGPVVGYYFSQKQSLKINAQRNAQDANEPPKPTE
jgi:hypothetical protein